MTIVKQKIEPSDDDFVGPRRALTREQRVSLLSKQRSARGVIGYLFAPFDDDGNICPTTPSHFSDFLHEQEAWLEQEAQSA